jgi:hypothetical protein
MNNNDRNYPAPTRLITMSASQARGAIKNQTLPTLDDVLERYAENGYYPLSMDVDQGVVYVLCVYGDSESVADAEPSPGQAQEPEQEQEQEQGQEQEREQEQEVAAPSSDSDPDQGPEELGEPEIISQGVPPDVQREIDEQSKAG